MAEKYLFLFTITPVQSFLAQARKTQDLFAGSYILSYLSYVAMRELENDWRSEIIFPKSKSSMPNRFLAIVDDKDAEVLRKRARDLEQKIHQELKVMAQTLLDAFSMPVPQGFWDQVENYWQVFWVLQPLAVGYGETYKQAEESLGQIKSVRVFTQVEEPGARKCALTGEHNALFYREFERKNGDARQRKRPEFLLPEALDVGQYNVPLKYMAPGEALGAIAFMKRFADCFFQNKGLPEFAYITTFPSTSTIALAPAFRQLEKIDPMYKEFLRHEFDEQDIFLFEKDKRPIEQPISEENTARKIYDGLKKYEISYSTYYAVLLFDGDSMGEWFSGVRLKRNVSLQEFHQRLSTQLAGFARKAREEILIAPRGAAVYAGGDDFLGLVNLDYLLAVLRELRLEFERIDLSEFTNGKLTFSAGVAVAHYKTPLSEVLKWARRMEKEAKGMDNSKDALGLAIVKRSGEISKFVRKWKTEDGWFVDRLESLVRGLRNDFSDSFVRTFHTEFRPLTQIQNEDKHLLRKHHVLAPWDSATTRDGMIKSEFKRLITRAYLKEDARKQDTVNAYANLWTNEYIETSLLHLLQLMETITFLAREVKNIAH